MAQYISQEASKSLLKKKKFLHDLEGINKNGANGIAFVTNQELRLGERKELAEINTSIDIQIYHLERIATIIEYTNELWDKNGISRH